ncbi:hypothetical protein HMI55_005787 [Coelomomyces lativittatus]|nr:hypothetical protein HMI55_005787 [Coelomomyces lativittatus]
MKTHGLEAVMSRLRPTAERIVLNGLTEAETGALIVMVWNQWAKSHPMSTAPKIQSVNPAFVSKLHSISSGNPLYSISLLVSFKDKNLFHINEQGMISVIQGQELDQVLPGSDLIALIFSQFDQLDPTFQTFLKIASVLGQTFSLMDMLDFLEYEEIRHQPSTQFNGSSSSSNSIPSNTSKPFSKFNNGTQNVNSMTSSYISSNYSKQMKPGSNQDLSIKLHSQDQLTNTTNAARVRNKISLLQDLDRLDQFGFLILPEPLLYSTPLPILEHTQVCFKNAAIRESIYSTLLISHRQTLHLSFAQYYESKLKDTGEEDPQLILKIYEHYNKTEGQVAKKIHYLVWVCHLYFKTHAMYEAIRHYTLLLEYVKKNQVASFRHYSTETRALWHRELAEAYLEIGEHDSAESHLRTTLKYLNAMVPKETPQWWLHCRTYWAYWRRHSKSTGSIADLNLRLETYVNYLELDLASKGRGLLHLYLIWQAYRFASSLKGSSSMVACCYALAGYAKLLHHGNINKGNELIQAALQRLPTFSEGVTLLPPWALVKSCEGVIAFFQGQFTHALNVFEQVVQLDMLRCSSLAVLLASQGLFVLGCFEGRHRACRMVAQWLLTKAQKEQHPPWRGKFWCCSILFLLDITLKKNHHPTFLSSSSSFSITASSPPSTSNSTYPMNFVPGNAPNLTQSSNGLTWEEEDVSVFLPLLNKSVANLESIYPLYSHQVAIECVMIVIRLEFRFWHEAVEEQTQLLKELNQIISKLKLYHWPAMLGIFMFLTLVWKAYVLKKVTYLGSLDDLRFALAKIQTHCATHWKFISWASDFAAFAFALDKCLINQSQKCATLWEEKMKKTSGCTNISVTTSTCWLNKYIGARIHLLCKNSLSQLSQTNEMELVPTSISILSNPAQKKKSLTNGRALGVEPEKENTTTTTHIKATAELFSAPST